MATENPGFVMICVISVVRLHVTLFDYRTVDDISGLIHPE